MLAGVSGRQLAHRTGLSQSRVSRIERGEALASIPELTVWMDVCGAADHLQAMIEATEAALNQTDGWREFMAADTLAAMQQQVRDREAKARTLRVFQPTLVPGLLQTAEYARLVFIASDLTGQQDYAAAVQRRVDRQQVLYEQGHRFEFVITEAALRWRPGPPEVQLAQIDRILNLSTLSNVSVSVVPLDGTTTAIPWHGFSLYEDLDEDEPFVQVETIHAYVSVTEPRDVALYRQQFEALTASAISGRQLAEMLGQLSEKLRDKIIRSR